MGQWQFKRCCHQQLLLYRILLQGNLRSINNIGNASDCIGCYDIFKTGATYLQFTFPYPYPLGNRRDIRNFVYDKIVSLPIGFFTSEQKVTLSQEYQGDVAEIENSIMSSLDMLFKNPIMIIVCIAMMITVSWQLTLFVFILLPIAGYIMGKIGKRLKRTSLEGQQQLS